jgi:hypothetical protein
LWQGFGLEKGPRRAHIPRMVIKRGSVWDGIKDAYHLHQAIEALGTLRQSRGRFLEDLGGMAMMIAALGVVVILLWLLK